MSSEDRPKVFDKTDQDKSSGEAVLILATVIGFFLVILIALCMLRHRKAAKMKVSNSKESIGGSHSRERASWTASTGPKYYDSESITNASLELIDDANLMLATGVEHGRYISNPTNSNQYYAYQNSNDGRVRKSNQWEYKSNRSNEHSTVIYQPESVLSSQYYSPYDKSTHCASEATDLSTSMEMIEEVDHIAMYGNNDKRKMYYHYNWTPEGRQILTHPINESQITSDLVAETPMPGINLFQSPLNEDNHNHWHLMGEDVTNSVSSAGSYTNEEIVSWASGSDRRLKGQRYNVIDEDAESLSEQGSRNTVRVSTPTSVEELGTVDIAIDNPFLGREESTTNSNDVTESHYRTGERNESQTVENYPQRRHSFEIEYETHDERLATSGYGDDSTLRGVTTGEKSYRVVDESNTPWMITEEKEPNIIRRSQVYQGYRSTVGMR